MNSKTSKPTTAAAQHSSRFFVVIQQSEEDWQAKIAKVLCVTVSRKKAREVVSSAPNTCILLIHKAGLYATDGDITFNLLSTLLREVAMDLGLDAFEAIPELLRDLYITTITEGRQL